MYLSVTAITGSSHCTGRQNKLTGWLRAASSGLSKSSSQPDETGIKPPVRKASEAIAVVQATIPAVNGSKKKVISTMPSRHSESSSLPMLNHLEVFNDAADSSIPAWGKVILPKNTSEVIWNMDSNCPGHSHLALPSLGS